MPAFVSSALAGRALPMFGDGRQIRDFVFVRDVAAVLLDAIRRRVTSDIPVNLATGSPVALLGLVDELGAILGQRPTIDFQPARTGDIRDSRADDTLFRQTFPDLVPESLGVGLKETIEWFRSLPD